MANTSAYFFPVSVSHCDPRTPLSYEVMHTHGLSGDEMNDLQSQGLLQGI